MMTILQRTLLSALVAAAAASAQTVNCVVAVVNGQIITLADVEVVAAFGLGDPPGAEAGTDPRHAALDTLIDQKIVLDVARETRAVSKADVAAARLDLARRLGDKEFGTKLARFGLRPQDLDPYLEGRLLFERALALRFSSTIPVSVTEVERHYRDIYVPEQTRAGGPVQPLDKVAETIEARIRGERRAAQTGSWVRDLRKSADIQIKKDCLK
jgi:parvulin-like peptidyl-prolyl isomerase